MSSRAKPIATSHRRRVPNPRHPSSTEPIRATHLAEPTARTPFWPPLAPLAPSRYSFPSYTLVMLDVARFPHLVDLVFTHAPREALLALRTASKDFCARADALFLRHIRVTSATNPWSDPEFWEYALSTPLGRPPLLRTWHDDMGRYVAHLGLWVDRAARRAAERTSTAKRLGGWDKGLRPVRVLELVGTVVPDGVGEFTSLLPALEVIVFTAAGEEDAADIAPFVYASAPTAVVRTAVDCGSHPTLPLPEVGDDSEFPTRLVVRSSACPARAGASGSARCSESHSERAS